MTNQRSKAPPRPAVGARFWSPRGRVYEVVGHMADRWRVVVRESESGRCDLASWALMIPANGWLEMKPRGDVELRGDHPQGGKTE